MATRCRTVSRPAMNLFRAAISKPSTRPAFSAQPARSSPSIFSRPLPQTGALMSLLPLHTAVSSAGICLRVCYAVPTLEFDPFFIMLSVRLHTYNLLYSSIYS